MDLSGCLWCLGSFFNGPCTALIFAGCQETDQSQQTVTCRYQLIQTTGWNAEVIKIFLFLFIGKFGKFLLDLCTDHKYFCTFFFCHLTHFCHMRIGSSIIGQIILCYICSIDGRLCSKEVVSLKPNLCVIIIRHLKGSRHLSIFQMCLDCLNKF